MMMTIHAHLVMNGNIAFNKESIVLEQLKQTSQHARVQANAALVPATHLALILMVMIPDAGLKVV